MSKSVGVLLVSIATSSSTQWGGEVNPIEIVRVPTYTEGVIVEHDGNLYVSYTDRISNITLEGKVSLWVHPFAERAQGAGKGTHLVCD